MSIELPKTYTPHDIELRWRTHWEKEGTFAVNTNPTTPYCIVLPPPNVTGSLHMGHALNITLQDILCRYARQNGRDVLWIPGTDHAGIATQNVVERQLAKEGLSRHDIGREAFIQKVWEWKKQYGNRITHQVRMLGASVDWSCERFTMDEGLSKAVRTVFTKLYNDGLLYRDTYSINWCPRCTTALADDEVEYLPQVSTLWFIRYALAQDEDALHDNTTNTVDTPYVVVATTRPETLLGDVALCVHPEDERYKQYIGKSVFVPLVNRKIPIIADNYVEQEFGTGVLKITPAHDRNDWELGKKHALPCIQVLDSKGFMNEFAGTYAGLSREVCRTQIVADLKTHGLLEKEESLDNNAACCYRCKTIIEPYVSKQWFVATTKLAKQARDAVPQDTQLLPKQWEKTYYAWLDAMRDWCISRQIWWGHRIPVWYCADCDGITVAVEEQHCCAHCASAAITQDEDVLDTWFSSALWPFTTLGYPEETVLLKHYYPTTVLVTGFDILFFWVARMMMMGQYIMHDVPFKNVYVHALIRDAEGRKMSKSTGNVIDPLDMIEKYGTDALRFTLTAFAAMGRDIKLSEERIEGYRHFINKLWNAARFILLTIDSAAAPLTQKELDAIPTTTEYSHHLWILEQLNAVKSAIQKFLAAYQFNEIASSLYTFVWNDFCDKYLELIKFDRKTPQEPIATAVALRILNDILILLHPIIPFCTAEIFAMLPFNAGKDIALASYPSALQFDATAAMHTMSYIFSLLTALRSLRSTLSITITQKIVLYACTTEQSKHFLEQYAQQLQGLAKIEQIIFVTSPKITEKTGDDTVYYASCVVENDTFSIDLTGLIDIQTERVRIQKELATLQKEYDTVTKKLNTAGFINNAPEEIIEKERTKQHTLKQSISVLESIYKQLI